MKPNKHITLLSLIVLFFVVSCKKKEYHMESLPDKTEINMEVKQDLSVDPGGNTIYLIAHSEKIEPIWDYGTGKSMRRVDTIHYAFKGDYIIKRTAVTGGGLVYLDSVVVHVTDDNLNYVNDPLWNAISGGVGQEKTWILDIDANYFDGPQFFYGTNNGWGGECLVPGGDCWNWNPKYSDNTWLMPYGDYGTMTFSLKGGPFVKVVHNMIPARGTENGTYYLDKDAKTLTMTNATPLHNEGNDGCVVNWGNIRLFSLTDNTMQLGVLRTAACGGACYLVYNYVAQ